MNFKIAIAQIDVVMGDVSKNLSKYKDYIKRARGKEVSLLVFPELSLTGYFLKDMVPNCALRIDSPAIEVLKKESKDISLVIGFIEESEDFKYYNSSAYLENGKVIHVHRKVYLPTYGMFEEARYFASGDSVRSFMTRFCKMAMLICEDVWHPSSVYIAALDGASVLIILSSSPSRGITAGKKLSSTTTWETLNKVYAQLYTLHVIFANRIGFEDGVNFWGGSEIVMPSGRVAVKGVYFKEGLITGEVSLDVLKRERIFSPLLRDEKAEVTIKELERIVSQLKTIKNERT